MKAKELLKVIGEALLLAVMIAIFGCLLSALGVGATILVGLVGWVQFDGLCVRGDFGR